MGGVTARKIVQGELDFSVPDNTRLQQALKQVRWTHRDDDGWIAIGIKPDIWSQYHLKMDSLAEKLAGFMGVENVYISQNSFYVPKRTIFTVRKLNALFVDLDYHHVPKYLKLTAAQMIMMLESEVFDMIPKPSFILGTGEGLALIWLIDPVPIKVLPLWQACENWLIQNLRDYGADLAASDAARVLRLAGTVNSGNGALASLLKIYDADYEYSLREIQSEYLPELKPFSKYKPKGNLSKIGRLFNLYTLHWARIEDLQTLQNMRADAGHKAEGVREIMCFLFRYWTACFTSNPIRSLEETLAFNEGFLDPLNTFEVEKATASAEKGWRAWQENFDESGNIVRQVDQKLKGYNYKNTTLIRLLGITQDEQRHMKTIISREEKQRRDTESSRAARRNGDGLTSRQTSKLRKQREVNRMVSEGLKPKEMAKHLDCSTRYVYSLLKNVN